MGIKLDNKEHQIISGLKELARKLRAKHPGNKIAFVPYAEEYDCYEVADVHQNAVIRQVVASKAVYWGPIRIRGEKHRYRTYCWYNDAWDVINVYDVSVLDDLREIFKDSEHDINIKVSGGE
ncbi:hypothetical protein OAF54_02945 [bacterium]|nr:hypothetical protein [bacterium]